MTDDQARERVVIRKGHQPKGERGYQPKAEGKLNPEELKPPKGDTAIQPPQARQPKK